jgi:mRNA-degrading endonuclease toxin of MazEF toxin-antitoxin module
MQKIFVVNKSRMSYKWAKCEQVTTMDKALLIKGPFAGRISDEKMKEIEKAIMIAIGVI